MKKLIIANWKAHPATVGEAARLAKKTVAAARRAKNTEVVICPPYPFLRDVRSAGKGVPLGAQDVFWGEVGAHTGEVVASQLKDIGVSLVIIGHSERRALGETDEMVNKKVRAAFYGGLRVVLCVGEPLAVRKRGLAAAKKYVASQLKKDLKGVKVSSRLVVAYEPIWAISGGDPKKPADKPENAVAMMSFIRKTVRHTLHVLYGGSVRAKNARSFLAHREVDGALVGGASLNAREFGKIVKAAAKGE
jgi:triosephosphate isomerase